MVKKLSTFTLENRKKCFFLYYYYLFLSNKVMLANGSLGSSRQTAMQYLIGAAVYLGKSLLPKLVWRNFPPTNYVVIHKTIHVCF